MTVDIFTCMNFHRFMEMSNFLWIGMCNVFIPGSFWYCKNNFHRG